MRSKAAQQHLLVLAARDSRDTCCCLVKDWGFFLAADACDSDPRENASSMNTHTTTSNLTPVRHSTTPRQ